MKSGLLAGAALLSLVRADPGNNCTLTGRPPAKARYLKFCQDYNPQACCIPGHDLENQVQFENLIDGLGPGCKNPMMYPEVRFFYCLGCDPEQPKFTDDAHTVRSGTHADGSGYNNCEVGDTEGDCGELGPGSPTIRICKSFLDKLWRDPAFDDCGVMYSNPCPTSWENADFDPYQCGDSLFLPRQEYDDNAERFINDFKPPGLDDYYFESVDDSVEGHPDCWIAKVYTNSAAPSRWSSAAGAIATAAAAGAAAVLL